MAEIDLFDYLTSFTVFGKTSDTSVSDSLKELVYSKDTNNPKFSDEELYDFIENSRPIDKSEIGVDDPIGLLKESMIVNNVLSKPISLPDQKIITKSNFTVAEVKPYFNRPETTNTSDTIKDFKKFKQPKRTFKKKDFDKYVEELENSNLETKKVISFNVEEKQTVIEDSIVFDRPTRIESLSTESRNWLKTLFAVDEEWGNSFRFNFTVYRSGTSIEDKPNYAKYDPTGISKISLKYVTKFRNAKRSKKGFSYVKNESYFQKKGIDFKVKGMLALKVSMPNSQDYQNKERTRNNPFITDLLKCGPDLNQNMFDVYLRFNPSPSVFLEKITPNAKPEAHPTKYLFFTPVVLASDKGAAKNVKNYVVESTFKDVYSLSVRTASVGIPLIGRETTTMQFLNTSVERPGNNVTFNNNGTLSIDCDANTYVLDMFMALSGLQRDGKFRKGSGDTLEDIQTDLYNRVEGHYPFMASAKLGMLMNTVDIVVSSHGIGMFHDKRENPGPGATGSNILYVFEDVRFMGTGSSLNFNVESSSSQSIDVPFIFKRLETYYRPDNNPYAIAEGIVRNSRFNNNNLKGTYYDEASIKPEKIGIGGM